MVPVHHSWLFFPKQAGLISGLILAGYGFGALIFDNVSTAYINPNGETVDEHGWYPADVNRRFKNMLRILIICWTCCILAGIAMIFKGPPAKKKSIVQTRPTPGRYITGASDYYSPKGNNYPESDLQSPKNGNVQSNDYSETDENSKSHPETSPQM